MITNKRLGLHLLLLSALVLLLPACSLFKKSPETPVEQSTPPPKAEQKPETPEVSAAETPPPLPVAESIRPGVPQRYTVKKGDTLWDIANHFLKDPWLWPEIWYVNPAIRNPHLIYPGDVIALSWVKGKPVLSLEGAQVTTTTTPPPPPKVHVPKLRTVKVSPHARVEKLGKAITTIPKSVIAPFLYRPFFITEDELDDAPYVVANYGNHIISGSGDRIYSRGIENSKVTEFNIVRKGAEYTDPDTGDVLGYEAINLGIARLVRLGDPQTLIVTKSYKEILSGDYLLPRENEELALNFYPRAPKKDIKGRIISVADGVSKIGQYDVVVINKGSQDGLKAGHVLEVYEEGAIVRQPFTSTRIKLPEERAGIAMVFKTYKSISYALIMEAFKDLKVNDYVYTP